MKAGDIEGPDLKSGTDIKKLPTFSFLQKKNHLKITVAKDELEPLMQIISIFFSFQNYTHVLRNTTPTVMELNI